jgi:hypothetical protein
MKRINIYITDPQHEALSHAAQQSDMPFSELLRRAIDVYLALLREELPPRPQSKKESP